MFQKIIHFIKYHNVFAIIFMIIFVGFNLSLAVSPDFRENFISSEETVRSVDNSGITAADLENFNFGLQIKTVTEDAENYYVTYTYKTYAIQDYIWQEVEKENNLTVSKEALEGRDLGLYVTEELGEVIDYELAYLKEVQQIEKIKGLTQKVVTTQYAGLIGRFLSPTEKVFEGYQPVVQPPEVVVQPPEVVVQPEPVSACQPATETCDSQDNDCDGEIDEGGVCPEGEPSAPYGAGETTPVTLSSIAITTPATKLVYTVGESLDITGLAITGTYSDGSSKPETITVANVTGFDSSTSTTAQILTIAVDGKTATYTVTVNDLVTITLPPTPDTTAPVITLVGDSVININVGDTYVDAGATAIDDIDGDITGAIVVDNPVNTATAGTYTVTYNVSDAAGNAATPVTRTVNVTEPEIVP